MIESKMRKGKTLYEPNQVLEAWQLHELLGVGGQGEVWKVGAATTPHSPARALKVCTSDDELARARFSQEVELLDKLDHPSIVRPVESGADAGRPFVVMELANTTLYGVGRAETAGTNLLRASPGLVLRLFQQAVEGIAHMHERELLHRDIKPQNFLVMLNPKDSIRCVVSDLGLAKESVRQGEMTRTQEVVGTRRFRAPEVALGGAHTKRSDVYSLGKVLEFLYAPGESVGIEPRACARTPDLTTSLWNALDELISRAASIDPKARFKDAADLARAIPKTVLTLVSPEALARDTKPAEVKLQDYEWKMLVALIAECPDESDGATVWNIRQRSQVGEYEFSMGLRRLRRIGFVESAEWDEKGYGSEQRVHGIRPSSSAFRWAETHEHLQPQPPTPSAEDIPF